MGESPPYAVFTLAERPDLGEKVRSLDPKTLPEFMSHGAVNERCWSGVCSEFPAFQIAVCEGDEVVAAGNTIPLSRDAENLPDTGWDAALEGGFRDLEEGRPPTVLSALLAIVGEGHQRRGLSGMVLEAMRSVAARHGLDALVAPVRSTMKSLYPLTPMERYVKWRRDSDGLLFDPWMRVHERLGAKVARVAPESMRITGSISDWERWAKMRFPESGEYVVEGALVPVSMDVERDIGTYVEPNVWMIHRF
ncbi:MAG: hypothetical protein ACRDSJ_23025 [Rubrobacteraceae bacterium]